MAVLFANNATGRLASSVSLAQTTISLQSGQGARFPSPTGGDWFPITAIKASGAVEIMRCTSRSGDLLTVARAQEATTALEWSPGDRVELRMTRQAIIDITSDIELDVTDLEGRATVLEGRTLTAGNGLTGGGNLTANRTFTLGTPGTLSGSTTNAVTAESHTHVISSTDSRTSTSTASLLQAKAMNDHRTSGDHDSRYLGRHSYSAIVRQGSWSRIGRTVVNSFGGVYLVSLNHTRSGVVVNTAFMVTCNHSNSMRLMQLQSGNYTQVQVRLTDIDGNNCFVEVLDSAAGAGDHGYTVTIALISAGGFTPITTYTAGGGTVRATLQTVFGDVVGSGAGLTSLNASNISSGTIADARLPYTAVRTSRTLTAGNGLSGGGDLSANRTITLGTPGAITATSTNSVTATSHTHEISTATVLALTAAGGVGAVGTYALLRYSGASVSGTESPGSTWAGSLLRYSAASGSTSSGTPSGTWRAMGVFTRFDSALTGPQHATLFMRIS